MIDRFPFQNLFFYSIFLRLVVVGSTPVWSDDIYRYLWDSSLQIQKINYFENTPREFVDSLLSVGEFQSFLYQNMNSPDYLSVYPPLLIAVYSIPIYFFPDYDSIVLALQLIWILVDVLIFLLLRIWFTVNTKSLWFYMGNPLVIIESIAQLHPEILILVFILVLVKFQHRRILSILSFLFILNIKISYLIYLPSLFRFAHWKRILVLLIFLLPIGGFLFVHYSAFHLQGVKGLGLFFHSFRFHGILESPIFWGLEVFDVSYLSGAISLFCFGMFLMWFVWFTRKFRLPLEVSLYYVTVLFLIFTPVFHPWYLIPAILLTVLNIKLQSLSFIFLLFSGFSYILYAFKEFSFYLTIIEIFILFIYVRKSYHIIFQKT
ncbi:MAG: hypothetical protein O9301_15975 [Leptospira sp.]|nr:hypothetical protein [Leptospira sp.]